MCDFVAWRKISPNSALNADALSFHVPYSSGHFPRSSGCCTRRLWPAITGAWAGVGNRPFLTLLVSWNFLLVSGIEASDPPRSLADYVVTSWGPQQGLSTSYIFDIGQDRDGFLWVGSSIGLIRFDGVTFAPLETLDGPRLPNRPVTTVHGARDGSLWAGFAGGGISRIQEGRVTAYGQSDGLGNVTVSKIREDRHGTIWAATQLGLYRFNGARWERLGAEAGLTEGPVFTAYQDRGDALWVSTLNGLFRDNDGDEPYKFELVDRNARIREIGQSSNGSIWITDPVVGVRTLSSQLPRHARGGNGYDLLWDRQGNLWVATLGQGVWFAPVDLTANTSTGVIDTWNEQVDNAIRCLFEDREGNVWAGGQSGLHKFSPRRAIAISDVGFLRTLGLGADKGVWAGGETLVRFSKDGPIRYRFTEDLPGQEIRAFYTDPVGVLWIATDSAVVRFEHDRFSSLPLEGRAWPSQIQSLAATDPHGALWISDVDEGLLRWTNGHLTLFDPSPEFRHSTVGALFADARRRIWIIGREGTVGLLDSASRFEVLRPGDNTHLPDLAFYEDDTGAIWLGGGNRLSRFEDGKLVAVDGSNGLQVGAILSITDDEEGYLWIGCREGILRLAKSEFDTALADPVHQLEFELFDSTEGFAGLPFVYTPSSSAIRADDGRLWFVTSQGLTVIDPRAFSVTRQAPTVRIDGLRADGERLAATAALHLPPRTAYLQIDYTAPTFLSPRYTQFRYRLEGFDTDWVYAGTRRTALYTGLPPRQYRFLVQARRSQTAWNQTAAEYRFQIEPTFYQTRWFAAACLAAIAFVGAAGWRRRAGQMRRDFKLILDERVRLSREMHDTLLQSLIGTDFQLAALQGELEQSTSKKSRMWLQQIRAQVEIGISEARQSILNLRSPRENTRDLSAAMRETGQRAVHGTAMEFALVVRGVPRPCSHEVAHQALLIGREALSNAVRHAHAREISVELCYEAERLVLRIVDDGCGFDSNNPSADTDHHYGLSIMQERAAQVGGQVTFHTSAGTGTVVEVLLPTSLNAGPQADST